ncbi:hypothetical protein O6H91_09G058000 [Diphasiastrum complanatum]|uniref:Uncharacterized protein n=1 Tax=Diphasiastrum complanatum TaxID=34168 RepID=A0ACC2CPF7_DIPCM|nr:hypothetical protein O6H91_09G058000 [Diphasiastrum complanatum]
MAASDQLQLGEEEFPNVAHIAARVEIYPTLHPRFVVPEDERFDRSSYQIISELQPPVIDLSLMSSSTAKDRAYIEKIVADGCRDDGFFQVINHGVPMELIKKLETFGYKFFSSSVEEKERFDLGFYSGYEGRHKHFSNPAPWAETFNVQISPFSNIDGLATLVPPTDTQSFRSLLLDCDSAMRDLGNRLLKLLEKTLSLKEGTYVQHFQKYTAALQIHHYPPCWHPSFALGAGPHADPSCLTILYQDSVGGLQVEKGEGKWVQINPVPDAFVINLGDIFQAWSNGLYKSSKHRVVLDPHKSRYSIGYFYSPQFEIPICVPNELVHADNPPKYRPFTCAEYYAFRGRRRQINRWENDLENFAGKDKISHC